MRQFYRYMLLFLVIAFLAVFLIGPVYTVVEVGLDWRLHHFTEGFLQNGLFNRQVGGKETEHGAHIGVNHAGAFRHAAQGHGLSADGKGYRRLFMQGIGGHNGFRCIGACLRGVALCCCQFIQIVYDFI